ncbi:MAG: IS66 family insertion sequence element accessory protein TnpA [Roseburia sp.]
MGKYTNLDWESIVQEQMDSGLTIAQFCEQKNIGEKAFYNYRKKISASKDISFAPVIVENPSMMKLKVNGILFEIEREHLKPFLEALWP